MVIASMATKCIDHMPPPKAIADIETTSLRRLIPISDAPCVNDRPVKPDIKAIASDAKIK